MENTDFAFLSSLSVSEFRSFKRGMRQLQPWMGAKEASERVIAKLRQQRGERQQRRTEYLSRYIHS